MRLMTTVVTLLRRLRAERGIAVLLVTLVAVTSFLVAVGPRLFARIVDDGLHDDLRRATAVQRNLQFSTVGQIPAQEDAPLARVEARGAALWDGLPASVQAIVESRGFVVETPRVRLVDPPNYDTIVTLEYRDGVESQIAYTAGRAPARAGPAEGEMPPRFEVAMSTATADHILVGVGDVLAAKVDPNDALLRTVFPRPTTAVELEVVGLFTVRDPSADFWYGESRLAQVSVGGTEEYPVAYASALFAPEAYLDVRALGLPAAYRWRFHVDAERIDSAGLEAHVPDLLGLDAAFAAATRTPGDLVYRSGLLDLFDRFGIRRSTSEATLSVAAVGPVAVATGAIALICLFVVRRRQATLLLVRGRGATARQLLAAQWWEGLLVAFPGALFGLAAATSMVPGRWDPLGSGAALLVALVVMALLLVATWPYARRARRVLARDDAPVDRLRPRRLVMEATIIGVALAAAWLLRERTVGGAAVADAATPDPFLAAAPALAGVAVSVLSIRLYPAPIRALSALAARRRGLVAVLGLRSVGRHPAAAYLPLLVLTLTVAIGVFSSVVLTTIDRGQLDASWQLVGADFRIEAQPGSVLRPEVDASSVPGVEAFAPVISISVAPVGGRTASLTNTRLYAVDPAAYQAVLADASISVAWPPALVRAAPRPASGTASEPIPAIVSERLPNGWAGRTLGESFRLQVGGRPVTFVIAAIAESFPGLGRDATFVVAPLGPLTAAIDASSARPTALLIRAPAEAGPGLHAMLAASPVFELEVSRHERYATVRDAPLLAAVGAGFGFALAVAVSYAALAVVASLALDAQRRAREIAYLRTLGLSDPQLVALTAVEHAPPVIVALLIGTASGVGVAWLLEPGLGLATFIDPGAAVTLRVDGSAILVIALVVAAAVVIAVSLSSWAARRLYPSDALRIGEG